MKNEFTKLRKSEICIIEENAIGIKECISDLPYQLLFTMLAYIS